jgi:hypothetical protein
MARTGSGPGLLPSQRRPNKTRRQKNSLCGRLQKIMSSCTTHTAGQESCYRRKKWRRKGSCHSTKRGSSVCRAYGDCVLDRRSDPVHEMRQTLRAEVSSTTSCGPWSALMKNDTVRGQKTRLGFSSHRKRRCDRSFGPNVCVGRYLQCDQQQRIMYRLGSRTGIPLASKGFGCKARVRRVSAAIRNERATTQTNPFQANPEGRWRFCRRRYASYL